ncbi:MAG: heat-inducible transcriptional repressor HrcA [Woeseia sp.]|nr:heat-inducible transcriptional repressor HrcA [Woeseia sp.]|tara:strand:- start:595 stop:1653 length:1059 start_codon:yes stop_codon:yes gene_type:complete
MLEEPIQQYPNERAQQLLKVLIQRFIRDGQPIGSRTLSRKSGLELSPATIRNVMSDLEDCGLIAAPHTSAGRVPTPEGYRLFVDSLIRYKQPDKVDVEKLEKQLVHQSDYPNTMLDSVSSLLSEITSLAGIVSVPKGQKAILRQIEFLSLADNRVLAILVINDSEVQNRVLTTEQPHTHDELQRAANYINQHYVGEDLTRIRQRLIEDLDRTRGSMNQAMMDIISVAQSAMDGAAASKDEFVVAGETNLMDFAELSDVQTLRGLFDAFSKKRFMLNLLDKSIHADGVQVFIGRESGYHILDNCSVVTAPYHVDDDHIGVLGVIGPTRMAYDRVVPIVDITARLLEAALNAKH